MKPKILITGGTGFIGSHLVERLVAQNRNVKVLVPSKFIEPIEKENLKLLKKLGVEIVKGDLLNVPSLNKAMKDVDVVYHLAAISRPMKVTFRDYYNANVQGTRNLLEIAKGKKLKRFIHVSTVSVLGVSNDGKPLKEDDFRYDDLQYGLTKREGEHIAVEYNYKHGVPVVVIRPSLVYGPRCLVRAVMFKYVKYGIFPIFNGGKAKMEFAYVDNVVDALLLAEKKNVIGEVFNITDGQSYEIGEILNTIADELKVSRPSLTIPYWVGRYLGIVSEFISSLIGIWPPFSRTAADWMSKDINVYSCDKAKELLGYKPKVSLKQGVKSSVQWYRERGLL